MKRLHNRKTRKGGVLPLIPLAIGAAKLLGGGAISGLASMAVKKIFGGGLTGHPVPHKRRRRQRRGKNLLRTGVRKIKAIHSMVKKGLDSESGRALINLAEKIAADAEGITTPSGGGIGGFTVRREVYRPRRRTALAF